MRQLDDFARATLTPVGFLYLPAPPDEELPISDLRTMGAGKRRRPTAALLDTLYLCQRRQEWYADYLRALDEEPLRLVGSARLDQPPEEVSADLRLRLRFGLGDQLACRNAEHTLTRLAEQAEALGVLVMRNGIVRNNTRWRLDPEEFRGFALVDRYAPLVFINTADAKAAQLFTIVHELAHIWLGESALTNSTPVYETDWPVERWCNRVAAEFLLPADELHRRVNRTHAPEEEVRRLAKEFRVSTLVSARRMHDLGLLSRCQFEAIHDSEQERYAALRSSGSGGDFYRTALSRISPAFQRAVVASTLSGHTLYREAFDLLAVRSTRTFEQLAKHVGLGV